MPAAPPARHTRLDLRSAACIAAVEPAEFDAADLADESIMDELARRARRRCRGPLHALSGEPRAAQAADGGRHDRGRQRGGGA